MEKERGSFDSRAIMRSLRTPFASLASLASRMVEAPGFAPGSENTSSQESTLRIRLCSVAPDVKKRKNRRAPTPENLVADVQGGRQQPACLNDIQFRPAG